MHTDQGKLSPPNSHTFPEEANQATPGLLDSALVLHVSVLSAVLECHVLLFSVVVAVGNDNDFTFEVTPGTAVKSCVVFPSTRDSVYLLEKAHVLDVLHSGMSWSAAGHEFSENATATYSK